MKSVMRTLMIAGVLLSVAVVSWAVDCSRYFNSIQNWASQKHDDYGKCEMEKVPNDSEYPADSIPYKLRNGKELCPKNRYEMDWEYLWENGKRISGIYYRGTETRMTLAFKESFIPNGPVRIFHNNKLFCEVPVNEDGKPDGIVMEYSPEGKLTHGFRMVGGKHEGGYVKFDEEGSLESFACEDKPVFEGDSERCGFNGKPKIVELPNGTILTHMNGKLTVKETFGVKDAKTVMKYSDSDSGEKIAHITEYNKNGKLYRTFSTKGENREGTYLEYTDNSKLIVEKEYKDGVDMVIKSYYMNGKLKDHSVRSQDGKSLSMKSYFDNGQLQSDISFALFRGNQPLPTGKAYEYTENGSLREEVNYDNEGNLDGTRILIDDKGKRTEVVYRKGVLLAKKLFSVNGKLELEEEYYEDGSRK